MDEKQLAAAAFQLLQRTQIQGSEVPVFVEVIRWLELKANSVPATLDVHGEVRDAPPESQPGVNGETRPDI